MKLCHLNLCRILRISGKLNSDKVASTIVINSYVNIFPKNGEFFFGLIFQINIRNFRNFRNLWNCDFRNFANNPIWFWVFFTTLIFLVMIVYFSTIVYFSWSHTFHDRILFMIVYLTWSYSSPSNLYGQNGWYGWTKAGDFDRIALMASHKKANFTLTASISNGYQLTILSKMKVMNLLSSWLILVLNI